MVKRSENRSSAQENKTGLTTDEKDEVILLEDLPVSRVEPVLSPLKVKDRGYAWVVLAAMCCINMINAGYVKCFGILYTAIQEAYPETSVTMAGVMMGLLTGGRTLFAPAAGAIGNMVGIRPTMLIGSTISVIALSASYFCTSTSQLAITLGALIGVSQCITESCQVIVVSSYFDERLSYANGVRVAGSPLGSVIFPLLLAILFPFYGLKLTFLMLAGLMAHHFVFSLLIRPFDLHLRIEGIKYVERSFNVRTLSKDAVHLVSNRDDEDADVDIRFKKRELLNEVLKEHSSKGANGKKKKPLELSYLKNPVYLLFVFMSIGIPMALPLVSYYSIIYAQTVLGLTIFEVSLIISVTSLISVFTRILVGWLNNKKIYKMSHGYMFCLLLCAAGTMSVPLTTGFWSLMLSRFFFSLGPSSFHTFISVILTNQFGKDSIATTWGFVRMTQGIFSFINSALIDMGESKNEQSFELSYEGDGGKNTAKRSGNGRPDHGTKDGYLTDEKNEVILKRDLIETEMETLLPPLKVRDRGYAWIVLAAMFCTNVLNAGYFKSLGIIYNAVLQTYPETSVTMAGVLMGLLNGCRTLFAPVVGAIGNLIGIRPTLLLGSALLVVACLASFFCRSAAELVVTLGAVIGLSHCLTDAPQVIVVSSYFERRLPYANGIRVAGYAFGSVVFPFLLAVLLQFYGLQLMFIMLAGVMAHIFIFSVLIRPFNLHVKIEGIKYIEKVFSERTLSKDGSLVPAEVNLSKNDVNDEKRKFFGNIMAALGVSEVRKRKPLQFSYLKDPVYLLFLLMSTGIPMAFPLVNYYSVIYGQAVLGLTVYEVSIILSVMSVADVCMRLVIGWMNNKKLYKMANGYIICMAISAAGTLLVPLTTGFWSLMLCRFVFGFGGNAYQTYMNVILTNQFGKEAIATTWGFVTMMQGIFSFINSALIGYIVDATGGYTAAFIAMGVGILFSCLMMLIEPFVIRITNSNVVIT